MSSYQGFILFFLGLLLGLLLVPTFASAEPGPAATVDYRHVLFESFGKHMKSMGMVAKGVVDRPASTVPAVESDRR